MGRVPCWGTTCLQALLVREFAFPVAYHYIAVANSVSGDICVQRPSVIQELLDLCRNLVDRYTTSAETSSQGFEMRGQLTDYRPACDAIVLGSLVKDLSNSGLWPIPEYDHVKISVTALGAKIMEMTCHIKSIEMKNSSDGGHEGCRFTKAFKKTIKGILDRMDDGVSASNLEHLKAQAEKCRAALFANLEVSTNFH